MIIKKFEEQEAKNPGKLAVVTDKKQLTYRELNHYANYVAQTILNLKNDKNSTVSSGESQQIVGLLFEHSADMIIGVLGALKAGEIYVPLDITYPGNRLEYMLNDSGAYLVLTNTLNWPLAQELAGKVKNNLKLINIDTLGIDSKTVMGNIRRTSPGNTLAYILYTSGSTGNPKGVMQNHENVCYYIRNWIERFSITSSDRMTLFSAFSHDGSVQDMFGALHSGATLYPYNILNRPNIAELRQWLIDEKITIWHSVPTLYRYFIDTLKTPGNHPDYIEDLRLILLGGEQIRTHDIEMFKTFFPGARFANVYGQTESSVSSIWTVKPGDVVNKMLIGTPLNNTCLLILSEQGEIIEDIGIGEIYICCPHIALGYWKDVEKTGQVFLHDPELGKLYRTGDLGRSMADGSIEIMGRKDSQVKIRGFRVEVGEIETRLLKHEAIREVVVISKRDETGNDHLCAYYALNTPESGKEFTLTVSELREYISNELPEYMIPSYFMQLEKLPVTPNGKVDRKKLPEPEHTRPQLKATYVAPTTDIEKKITEIWGEALKLDKVGVDDNFFDLGGTSFDILKITRRIFEEFKIEVSVVSLFRYPSIRLFVDYLNLGKTGDPDTEKPTIELLSQFIDVKTNPHFFNSITPVESKEYYVLSPAQKRLYILHEMESVNEGYNLTFAYNLEGRVDLLRFEDSFRYLIERHECLRTSFLMVDGKLVQRIHEDVQFKIEYYDVSDRFINDFARPFDLSKAPLMRVGLLKSNEAKYVLIFDIHHIIFDGSSMVVFFKEFIDLYLKKELPDLRIQYKDYAEWHYINEVLEKKKGQEAYWLDVFSGEIPVIRLPLDFPRPLVQSFEGRRLLFVLEEEELNGLKNIVKQEGVTLYMTLLAALNVLLMKLSGQEDIVVGSPFAGREKMGLENIVGIFINTLALRNYPAIGKTFVEFLEEVKESVINAMENQDYQFEELVEKVVVQRDVSRNPLLDVLFRMQNFVLPTDLNVEIEGLELTPYVFNSNKSFYDLDWGCREIDGILSFSIDYGFKLFKEATIERFIHYFKVIVRSIIENRTMKLSEIDIIPEEEKNRLLYEFNATTADYPKEKTIHELFEEQVERTPGRIAVVGVPPCYSSSLTYRELNDKSNSLAHVLIEKGAECGAIVGIALERSVEILVGIMGILKSGAAYLPIDPDTPEERIQYMFKDSGAKILLNGEFLKNSVLAVGDRHACSSQPLNFSTSQLLSSVSSVAYVIYTSGSTGKPKGVMIEHCSVVNFIKGITDIIPFTVNDRILSLTTISFDIFGLETLVPLVNGSTVVMGSAEEQLNPGAAGSVIEREIVSIFQVTPSRLQMIISIPEAAVSLKILKFLLIGGEAFPGHLLEKARTLVPGRIFNMYGPTETTIWSAVKELSNGEALNIGKPIANTQIYIIDNVGNLQPLGVVGELCIGGAGLARGYLNRPLLTNEKFLEVQEPFFKKVPGRRRQLYKTGDLARWLEDGNIEFLGRKDFQVKIRGFRIELEEIENCLRKHESIEDVAVFVKERGANTYLCAAIVADGAPDVSELRHFLSRDLPEYMIPSSFSQVEKIPLNPNGKVDRKALLALKDPQLETGSIYVAPETESEKIVAQLWQEVLKLDKVGIEDNFFDLGGNSMDVILLNKRLNEALGTNIPVVSMFRYTTIQSLMQYLNDEEATGEALEKQIEGSMSIREESMSIWENLREE